MKPIKLLVFLPLVLTALYSCKEPVILPTGPGFGPYLPFFSNLNRDTGDNRLSTGDLNVVGSRDNDYRVSLSNAASQRESVFLAYSGFRNLALLRISNLVPASLFHTGPGRFFRTAMGPSAVVKPFQVSSDTNLAVFCDRLEGVFIAGASSLPIIVELPGSDGCDARGDNEIRLLSEQTPAGQASIDLTARLNFSGTLTTLDDIAILYDAEIGGTNIINGYLVANGLELYQFDGTFANPQLISTSAVTSIKITNGGTGLVGKDYVQIDGANVYRYDPKSRSVVTTPVYAPSVGGASIDTQLCIATECLFVENTGAGVLNLWVVDAKGQSSAQILIADLQNISDDGASAYDAVLAMTRNIDDITFTAARVNPAAAADTIGLYDIDLQLRSNPLKLLEEVGRLPAWRAKRKDTGSKIDLFLTNGKVYYNKDYDRINSLTSTAEAVVFVPDSNFAGSDRTIIKNSAWVGTVDTVLSRQVAFERIILARTDEKIVDEIATGEPLTTLSVYSTDTHTLTASLGSLVDVDDNGVPLDIVHMSFQIVGRVGLGDAFITSTQAPSGLQSDVYFINTTTTNSLQRITTDATADESAFFSCVDVRNLFCR
ncbi:MAG: hypothetical protein ACC707_16320 [Thiohalomonadales bacterium]